MKISKYDVIVARTPADLVTKVNKHIEEGWQLHGVMTSSPTRGEFVQAMVQEKPAPARSKAKAAA